MTKPFFRALSVATLVVTAACSGGTGDEGDAGGSGGSGGHKGGSGGGKGGSAGSAPVTPVDACKLPDDKLPPARIWRLSAHQIAGTVKASFGVSIDETKLPGDGAASNEYAVFDTWDTAIVDDELGAAMADVAEQVSKQLVPQLTKDAACLAEAKPASGCVGDFVAKLGEKAFRRPLDDDEKARLSKLFNDEAAARGGASAAGLVVEALLQSPRFLYRSELGNPSSGDKRVGLTQWELASQLSYLLTDLPPDADLIAAARDGKLRDPKAVREHAARLADSAGARAKYVDFFTQVFSVKQLATVAKDATAFPMFTADVRAAMQRETATFVEKTLWDDAAGVKALYTADYGYLNAKLAPIYGANASGLGDEMKKTTLPAERRGILSQAGLLAANAHPDGTSPTLRGLFIYQRLLCHAKPEPPAGAADQAAGKLFDPASPMNTQREHFEFAQKHAPECMACHGIFGPVGLGLEQFDGMGRYRTTEFGKTIDTSVTAKGVGEGIDGSYKNTLELGAKIMDTSLGQQCLVKQAATFGFGRLIDEDGQACEVEGIAAKVAKNGVKVQDVLVELTQTDSFYNRQPAAP